MKKAIILLSGGLDSATCCAFAKKESFDLYAISFSYGQRHMVELEAAKRVAQFFDVCQHQIISLDKQAFDGSSLTSLNLTVPKNRTIEDENSIPNTYVPARNTIFLSYALGWAEVLECQNIFIGVNSVDYSGYPDCRPEFISAFEKMANLATKTAIEGNPIKIHTPLISMSKAEIIRSGISMGVDYSITHSCYDPSPNGLACGHCDSCILRRNGFNAAQIKDPTIYFTKEN